MSNKFPAFSHIDSNNSGLNVSVPRVHSISTRILNQAYNIFSPFDIDSTMSASRTSDSTVVRAFIAESDNNSDPSQLGDHVPSSPNSSSEISGATIEVITVEKYKRSDGFANPYHIQGLNASTPDDVDDDDEEEEEDGEGNTSMREDETSKSFEDHENVDLIEEGEEKDDTIVSQEVEEDETTKAPVKDLKNKHPSIPTSAESTVSSESPCLSNTSSIVPSQTPKTAPRSDSVSSGVNQPQHRFQFTVERVTSSDNSDQTPTADQQPAHITPPVSVSRAATSESIFASEVPSDTVSIDESLTEAPTPQSADVMQTSGAPWMPPEYQHSRPGTSAWASAEMAVAAAATAAVTSAVVNPGVSTQTSQGMPMGQSNPPNFSLAVAAATAAVAAICNMQPSNVQPELPTYSHHPELPGISGYTPYSQPDGLMYQHQGSSIPHSTVSALDRVSTPSPGPMTQSSVATPPQSVDSRPVDTIDSRKENDEGEIRFRRARYLEKRERWHDKRFLVVDTFRREEPVNRPEVKLPDPTYPMNCERCLKGTSQVKVRQCPCASQTAAILQQKIDRHRYPDHSENHGYIPSKMKHKVESYFGYPEMIAIVERASQVVVQTSLAESLHSPRASNDMNSNVEAVGRAAAVAAAAAASMSNSGSREPSISCTPSTKSIPNITLRRKGLQRNNSHFHINRSSPSSFSANEIPQVDQVAAMAVAAVVSVTAAMAGNERRDWGLRSERSSETEQPANPPTSPASGQVRNDPMNRSSSVPEAISLSSKSVPPPSSVDNRTLTVNKISPEQNSSTSEDVPSNTVTTSTRASATSHVSNQLNAHMAEAISSPAVDMPTISNGRHKEIKSTHVSPPSERRDEKVTAETDSSVSNQPSQPADQTSSAIHSKSSVEPSQQSLSRQRASTTPATEGRSRPKSDVRTSQTSTTVETSAQQQSAQTQPPASSKQRSSTTSGAMVSTGSMGATEPYQMNKPAVPGSSQVLSEMVGLSAAYAAQAQMMSYGSSGGVPMMSNESTGLPVNSNTSSMNYLDQYRMQHILPVGPASSSAAPQEPPRQTTEARIAQSLDNVRSAMTTYFRELEEMHTYQIKALQEEVRQLREQRERDLAIIREYVPHECLLQLGHPYASLVQSSRNNVQNSSIQNSTIQQPQMSQATDSNTSATASQSHLSSVHSTQSSQTPSQQPE